MEMEGFSKTEDMPISYEDIKLAAGKQFDSVNNETQTPFIEWSTRSFEEIENLEVEEPFTNAFYKSFFVFMHMPEVILKSFWLLLTSGIGKVN